MKKTCVEAEHLTFKCVIPAVTDLNHFSGEVVYFPQSTSEVQVRGPYYQIEVALVSVQHETFQRRQLLMWKCECTCSVCLCCLQKRIIFLFAKYANAKTAGYCLVAHRCSHLDS